MSKYVAPPSLTLLKRNSGTKLSEVVSAPSSILKFRKSLNRLAETPLIYQVIYRDVRRAIVRRFPYLIWYRVLGAEAAVLACTHGRQDPDKAISRLP
jgi:plasmid stabilization system protein ParE